jgi:hypothetical protein
MHGVDDNPIFRKDDDRQDFVLRLGRVVREYGWGLYAYCSSKPGASPTA